MSFDWFPDWTGQACAIVASGPSTRKANVGALQGRTRIIAIKENVELLPFADVVYGCDADWWKNENGLPHFAGLKIAWDPWLGKYQNGWSIRLINIRKSHDVIITEPKGTVGSGGNSAFHALNLAIQWGANRILLVGVDLHDRNGIHWFGKARGAGRVDPTEDNFRRWRRAFAQAAPAIAGLGVEVVNASAMSDLRGFRNATIEQALTDWHL